MSAPVVLNMKQVHHAGKGDVYIGRPSKWGNPFLIGVHGTREEVVRMYEVWLQSQPHLLKDIVPELRGQNLVCWCAPLVCHGDILLRLANHQGG